MFRYIKYLIQLVLAPAYGWEDLGKENPEPDSLFRRGLLPLLLITAVTELLALVYDRSASIAIVVIRAFVDFGSYFTGYFIAKLMFESYIPRLAKTPDIRRSDTLAVMTAGIMVTIQLIDNVLPWNVLIIRFLPVYSILVLYRAAAYMHIPPRNDMAFLGLSILGAVIAPLAIYYLFYFLLP